MSLLSKFTKTAGTIADKVTESVEKTANIASLVSDGVEVQVARFVVYSESSLEDTLLEDELARAERAAKLAEHGINPDTIKQRKLKLLGRE